MQPPSTGITASDERSVAPLVGNILMVAVVVVLGTVLTVFAFSYLDSLRPPAPEAAFSGEFTESDRITITHTSGDTIPAEDLEVRVADASGTTTRGTWKTLSGGPTDVAAGDSISDTDFNGDETVYLLWKPAAQDRSHILSEFQTRNINSPLSSASVSEDSGQFASQRGTFGERAWQSLIRIGGGSWELGVDQDDNPPSANRAQYSWQNGQSVPFTLSYNQDNNEEASITVDGTTASVDTTPFPTTGDTIGLTVKTASGVTGTVSVSDLRLNGLRLSQQSLEAGTGETVNLHIDDSSIANGFVLTGSVTFDWTGGQPANSQMQVNFEIEEAGTP